ncbi:MAG TPA: hypothetical protein VKE27_03550 [Candidatus Dormibacteraeota bacterium]|nr:hypothetical protein [Candidatus Dormibacteraeota bacterium]
MRCAASSSNPRSSSAALPRPRRCHTSLTLLEAWAGNGFRRRYIARRLKAARDEVMQRIKGILEAEAASVFV